MQVTSASGSTNDDESHDTSTKERDSDELTQEEKPRSRIIAEYLAHGYVIGDSAVQRAIDLDSKHGVSNRFLSTLQNLDAKYHATDKAKSVDQSYGVTQRTNSLLQGLTSYYEKAAGTPTGQRLVDFYTQTSRQVQDIHAEARRLADLKKQDTAGSSEKPTGKLEPVLVQHLFLQETILTLFLSGSAHDVASTGTGIVDSSKVAPLEPEKTA